VVAEVASKAIAEVEAEFDAKEAAKAKVRRRPKLEVLKYCKSQICGTMD
jgi:hypothetical protein